MVPGRAGAGQRTERLALHGVRLGHRRRWFAGNVVLGGGRCRRPCRSSACAPLLVRLDSARRCQ
jgi:hypothetical protein